MIMALHHWQLLSFNKSLISVNNISSLLILGSSFTSSSFLLNLFINLINTKIEKEIIKKFTAACIKLPYFIETTVFLKDSLKNLNQ